MATTASLSAGSKTAKKQWELENGVKTTTDDFYNVPIEKMKRQQKERPWKQNPTYFKSVRMSALALIKIVMHAKSGQGKAGVISQDKNNWVEVMGLMQGYFDDDVLVVTDSFAMPVEASEVNVSMNEASQLYMVEYLETCEKLGKKERCVGWYHSHPGYTCFLSGLDVTTQTLNQTSMDPFIAVVVDPVRTISTGKVEIKAFRTYPEGYTPSGNDWDLTGIPQSRIEEFGVYLNKYYPLPITYYRSEADATELDLLWNKYWMKTLSTSPLVTNRFFIDNSLRAVTEKFDKLEAAGGRSSSKRSSGPGGPSEAVTATSKAISSVTNDMLQGIMGMEVKQHLFNDGKQ